MIIQSGIMSGSRVFLDLSNFFSDVRQQSCIFLDYEGKKTVKDVEDHIRRVFGVDRPFHILNDGWLLPSSESSLILRDNDTVSIVPEGDPKFSNKICKPKDDADTTTQEKKSTLTSSNSLANVNGEPEIKEPAEKNDFRIPRPVINIKNGKSNGFEKPNICVKNPFASTNSSSDPNRTISGNDPKPTNDSNKQLSAPPTEDQETASECESGERKRKRIRRRKKKSTNVSEMEPNKEEKTRNALHDFFQGLTYKSSIQEQNKKKHIFFKDEEENSDVKVPEPAGSSVSVGEHLSEHPDQPSINSGAGGESQPLKQSGGRDNHVLQKTSSGNPLGDLSKLMALGNQQSPVVFERKKSENPVAAEIKIQPPKKTTSPADFKLTALSSLPVKETIIKFKVLKMVNYSPMVSDMITARVISPDFTSNQLFVQITEGLNELQSERGKFSLDGEEEQEEEALSEYMYLNWHDLLDPKAVEYC